MTGLRILCCSSVSFANEVFATLGSTRVLESSQITRHALADVDVLIARSTTRVDEALLSGTPVRFVGTATAGTDHLNIPFLETHGIEWADAPGSNANSVAEYITTALLLLHRRHGLRLERRILGIIGVGHVGRRVHSLAQALGMKILLCDPPLAEQRERDGKTHPFVSATEIITQSDVITLHVPLILEGPYTTQHMVNETFLRNMKRGATLINAARGSVIDSEALRRAYRDDYAPAHLILDTWEPEPAFPWDLLEKADIATPHIAGYSIDGKVAGTIQVAHKLCQFIKQPVPDLTHLSLPPPQVPELILSQTYHSELDALSRTVPLIHGIEETDRNMRRLEPSRRSVPGDRANHFRELRKNYPKRREFSGTSLRVPSSPSLVSRLRTLGFSVHAFA